MNEIMTYRASVESCPYCGVKIDFKCTSDKSIQVAMTSLYYNISGHVSKRCVYKDSKNKNKSRVKVSIVSKKDTENLSVSEYLTHYLWINSK
jgi:hypothetical protein